MSDSAGSGGDTRPPIPDADRLRETALPRWIVSSHHARRVFRGYEVSYLPYGAHHAREIGSTVTACGLPAHFWRNFYDQRYMPAAPGSCPRCDEVVEEATAS